MNPVARSVLEAVGEVTCAKAFANPKRTTRAVKVQLRENFRVGSNSNERLRLVVVVCFKLLMGVPWHAFPPEALLVRRILEGLFSQISEKRAASVNSVLMAFHFERRLI